MKQMIVVFVMIVLVSGAYAKMPDYLPQAAELKEWEPVGTAEYVVGDDLFLLINGGAEIYHEYGFKQEDQPSLGFNLEIYEMQNPEAAYGVYTFKTGDSGKPIDVGNEGLLEDYYINFWKGNFQVTVIGFDSKKETLEGIIQAAKIVNAKIKETGQKPKLLQLLPKGDKFQLKPNGITYLKGNLALFNQYEFDSKDIFGLKEGVVANYQDFRFFIFQYKDATECKKWFDIAKKYLENNPSYKDFSIKEASFSFTDNKNNPFYIQLHKQYILIIQGTQWHGPHGMGDR
jgi:hypothetical protein